MNESQSMVLEALKIITDFFSNNSIAIVFLFLLFICRTSISNFISRLTSLTYKNGRSELGMKASAPTEKDKEDRRLRTEDERPSPANEEAETEVEIEKKEAEWMSDMYQAFDEGRIDDAELSFKKYGLNETDEVKLEENKAFYLYLKFEKGQDNSAIEELEQLSRKATTEESKINTLMWLSFCLRDSVQYQKESELWRSALKETKSESLKTTALVNLSHSLVREELFVEAKKLITNRLLTVENDKQKALLYEALSEVEYRLGNKSMSIYCKDKSLEFDVNNRSELFRSAYAASEEDIDEISISNYVKLLKIDKNNSTALNNLGVRAQEAGLKIMAVDQYKESSNHNNTLSMANQGFLLLGAGFADEAEKIAKNALKDDDPHQNVHNLLSEISDRKEKQKNDWEELSQKSLSRQKQIREYTQQYYLGNSKSLEGDWYVNGVYPMTIKIDKSVIEANWIEAVVALDGNVAYTAELSAKVSGSTIEGTYTRKRSDGRPSSLLGLDSPTNQAFIGHLSNGKNEISLMSKNFKDNFKLSLSRQKS
ncbi:tetratricopeptide repeat protein [Marinobacter sp. GN3S48]|uniref:tetratricopeptide repeat protein n=1 Tax=Marinobacter sp. GN3S48 TaxID=3382302 RepID=UPI00387B013C